MNAARDAESPGIAGKCVLFIGWGEKRQSLIIFPKELPFQKEMFFVSETGEPPHQHLRPGIPRALFRQGDSGLFIQWRILHILW